MKKRNRMFLAMMIAVFLLSVFALPTALAAGATSVWVNNVELNAGNPYWKNGNLTASASDWNAYFDASSYTLTLRDAQINTVSDDSVYTLYKGMIYANGDFTLALSGASRLTYAGAASGHIAGVYGAGSITVTGEGSIDVGVTVTGGSQFGFGICAIQDLTVTGGTLTIGIHSGYIAHGLYSRGNILYTGGRSTINNVGSRGRMVYTDAGVFRMTGGWISGTSETTGSSGLGLAGDKLYLEGGYGSFYAFGTAETSGCDIWDSEMYVSGGHFIFAGERSGIFIDGAGTPVISLTNVTTYVSASISGSGKYVWHSPADGELAYTYFVTSPFRYVEFVVPEEPQTGDAVNLWLWAGIALCVGLMMAGIPAAVKRRRTR